jgi:hypothetical protein
MDRLSILRPVKDVLQLCQGDQMSLLKIAQIVAQPVFAK